MCVCERRLRVHMCGYNLSPLPFFEGGGKEEGVSNHAIRRERKGVARPFILWISHTYATQTYEGLNAVRNLTILFLV